MNVGILPNAATMDAESEAATPDHDKGDAAAHARGVAAATGAEVDAAPEMREYHDRIFSDVDRREALYDNLFDLPKLTQVAHFRRMEILSGLSLPSLEGATVLDFGSGPWGFAAVFPRLRSAAVQITCDVSFEALCQAQVKEASGERSPARRLFITSDGDAIGLADSSVDVVWAGEVIEHVRLPGLFLQEIARILKPGGTLVLSTPNRDAPIYAARGLQNAVGPEHIALLSAGELRDLVSTCFDIDAMLGYEFSLCHEADAGFRDEAMLNALQERALYFPELSSGIVLAARVSKARHATTRRNYARTEIPWQQCVRQESAAKPIALFGDVHGGFIEDGATLVFRAKAARLILLFWSHDWSGIARIAVDGKEHLVDLYSHAGGFRRIDLDLDDGSPHEVAVSRVPDKREASSDTQVIFYKAIAYTASTTD